MPHYRPDAARPPPSRSLRNVSSHSLNGRRAFPHEKRLKSHAAFVRNRLPVNGILAPQVPRFPRSKGWRRGETAARSQTTLSLWKPLQFP
jgi:hypothetical protein